MQINAGSKNEQVFPVASELFGRWGGGQAAKGVQSSPYPILVIERLNCLKGVNATGCADFIAAGRVPYPLNRSRRSKYDYGGMKRFARSCS